MLFMFFTSPHSRDSFGRIPLLNLLSKVCSEIKYSESSTFYTAGSGTLHVAAYLKLYNLNCESRSEDIDLTSYIINCHLEALQEKRRANWASLFNIYITE